MNGTRAWALGPDEEGDVAVLTILFADIANSTQMNNDLGDETWSIIRGAFFGRCGELAQTYRGRIIKPLGDGILIAFHAMVDALDFALSLRFNTGHELVAVHVGIDVGPVLITDDDVFGGAVNYAARLESEAKRDEILLSESAKSHIDAYRAKRHAGLRWSGRTRQLKGFKKRSIWSVDFG